MRNKIFKKLQKKWKAAKEEHKESDWQKIVFVIIIILNCLIISGLGVNAYITNEELHQLKNHMTYLSDTSNVILSGVDNMQENIAKTLKEEASLIEDWSIELKSTNFAAGTYTVDLMVIPKEYKDTTQVELYFGTKKYELQMKNYKYVGEADLALRNRYDGNVTILLINGKKKNTEVLSSYRDIQYRFEEILSGSLKEIPEFKDGILHVNQDFSYMIADKNVFGFTELSLVFEVEGEDLQTFDLLRKEQLQNEANENEKENMGVQNPDGNVDLQEDTELPETVQEISPVYLVDGSYFVQKDYEIESGMKIRIYIMAVCQEGFTFTYDLFQGITEEGAVKGFKDAPDYFDANAKVFDADGIYLLD